MSGDKLLPYSGLLTFAIPIGFILGFEYLTPFRLLAEGVILLIALGLTGAIVLAAVALCVYLAMGWGS